MKLTTGIVFLGMVAGTAWGQNPNVINNTRDTLHAVQQKKASSSDAALAGSKGTAASPFKAAARAQNPAKKTAGAPATRISAGPASPKAKPVAGHKAAQPKQQIAVENQKKPAEAKTGSTQINLSSRRDPFVSPVVNRSMLGSGCSTGKRCLSIEQINLKGVVKADSGMIAVVVNTLNKAYFLRENDPVFNGYVVRITGDSIIFKQTIQDRLGKSMTREVTKKITTSAV